MGSKPAPVELKDILDPGIASYVMTLREHGIETYESCQSGEGHCFLEPTIRFYGEPSEGLKAVAICLEHRLPVSELRRVWSIHAHADQELNGPFWELTFWYADPVEAPDPDLSRNPPRLP